MKPTCLDLFCCAGGAGMGYSEHFNVHGIDLENQPNYPLKFSQADALEYAAEHAQWPI